MATTKKGDEKTAKAAELTDEERANLPMKVEYLGGKGIEPASFYLGATLPSHAKAGDTFEIETWRARSLVRYFPDAYRIVKAPKTPQAAKTEEG